jgi:hypothetical protein
MLEASAKLNGNVDNIFLFKERDIDNDFYLKNNMHFKNIRGFGFWVWKPYFIKKMVENCNNEDVFIYVDAGNEVIGDLNCLYNLCLKDSKGVILFENTDGEPNGNVWTNNIWTKSDCFNLMGLKESKYIYGNQVNASYIVFRKTDFSKLFFDEYLNYCENYNIISDEPNITENFNKDFIDHRHDQSILSLLAIKYNIKTYRDPSECGNHKITKLSEYGQLFNHHRRKYI